MSKTNQGWIGLIVGLVVGMSIGAAVAVPAAQQYVVDIMSWPENLNVTLTNPPTIPTMPADSDGDSVPDNLDAFPMNPSLSQLYALDVEANGSSGALSLSVTCILMFGDSLCLIPFVPTALSISWNVTAFNPNLYSFEIRTQGLEADSAYSCVPRFSSFASDRAIGTYTRGFPLVALSIGSQSDIVEWWACFGGIRIDLSRGGNAYADSYLKAHIEFVA